jgi:4-diphosphocytidyl-2-C-methyl-D-erythritol kinase
MSYDMRVRAFAKINRSLRVLGIRSDGYHELRTIFQSIALHDTLTIHARRGAFALTCDDPACPTDETNLVARAAARLWRAAGRRGAPRDVAIDLQKRIPMQAGLGGGSSDAAAALRALARRWRVGEAKVRSTAAALGADVPYFLEGGAALGLERGDLLFRLAEPPGRWVVLVLPDFGVSTKEAFAWFDRDRRQNDRAPIIQTRVRGPERAAPQEQELVNDLEAPVAVRHPEIARVISSLRRSGASHAAMSGSGSAVFGLFCARETAVQAARRLKSASRRTLVTRTLNHQNYGSGLIQK